MTEYEKLLKKYGFKPGICHRTPDIVPHDAVCPICGWDRAHHRINDIRDDQREPAPKRGER